MCLARRVSSSSKPFVVNMGPGTVATLFKKNWAFSLLLFVPRILEPQAEGKWTIKLNLNEPSPDFKNNEQLELFSVYLGLLKTEGFFDKNPDYQQIVGLPRLNNLNVFEYYPSSTVFSYLQKDKDINSCVHTFYFPEGLSEMAKIAFINFYLALPFDKE
jgi:hypothetical protein